LTFYARHTAKKPQKSRASSRKKYEIRGELLRLSAHFFRTKTGQKSAEKDGGGQGNFQNQAYMFDISDKVWYNNNATILNHVVPKRSEKSWNNKEL